MTGLRKEYNPFNAALKLVSHVCLYIWKKKTNLSCHNIYLQHKKTTNMLCTESVYKHQELYKNWL